MHDVDYPSCFRIRNFFLAFFFLHFLFSLLFLGIRPDEVRATSSAEVLGICEIAGVSEPSSVSIRLVNSLKRNSTPILRSDREVTCARLSRCGEAHI